MSAKIQKKLENGIISSKFRKKLFLNVSLMVFHLFHDENNYMLY